MKTNQLEFLRSNNTLNLEIVWDDFESLKLFQLMKQCKILNNEKDNIECVYADQFTIPVSAKVVDYINNAHININIAKSIILGSVFYYTYLCSSSPMIITKELFCDKDVTTRESSVSLIRTVDSIFKLNINHEDKLASCIIRLSFGLVPFCHCLEVWKIISKTLNPKFNVDYKFELCKKIAIENGCYDNQYKFKSENEKLVKLNKFNIPIDFSSPSFEIIVLIGIAGSGKDYYISHNNPNNYPTVCRDDIRTEIGILGEKPFGTSEEEAKVTDIVNEKVISYCKAKQSFIYNNMNLKKKYRLSFLSMVLPYNPTINYVYIEAPSINDCIKRRNGQIPSEVITRMVDNIEFPDYTECSTLKIIKQ